MSQSPFFHEATGAVRFWVAVEDQLVGASVSREALHHRYRPDAHNEDPLETYKSHAADIDNVVRRRVAQGSIEPVMLREFDLRVVAPKA
ncbi:MAG: DUF1488 family protein [Rubrivivax sp.]|nr:MAG: DUF1488 family protein [Rubrivivax sp.]